MKKNYFVMLKALLSAFMLLAVVSCENFQNGSELKKQVDEQILVANADSVNVEFKLLDSSIGTISPNSINSIKVGKSFDIELSLIKGVTFSKFNIYEKTGTGYKLVKENLLVNLAKEDDLIVQTVYKFNAVLKTASSELLVIPEIKNINDSVAPVVMNDDFYSIKSSKYAGVYSYDFYVKELESTLNNICKIGFYDFWNEKFCEMTKEVNIENVGNGFYHIYFDLPVWEVKDLPYDSNKTFYPKIEISDINGNSSSFDLYDFEKKTEELNSFVVYTHRTDDPAMRGDAKITESEMNNYTYKLLFYKFERRPEKDNNPKLEWGYTQNLADIENIRFTELNYEYENVDYELDVSIDDKTKDTYVFVKTEEFFNEKLMNVFIIPAPSKRILSELLSEIDGTSVKVWYEEDYDDSRSTILYTTDRYTDGFHSYPNVSDNNPNTLWDSSSDPSHPHFLRSMMLVGRYESRDYYLWGPLSEKYFIEAPSVDIIKFNQSAGVTVTSDSEVNSNKQFIKIESAENIFNQFDRVVVIAGEYTSDVKFENNNITFVLPSDKFYDELTLSRIPLTFSIVGIKNGTKYETNYTINTTVGISDNIPPHIPDNILLNEDNLDYYGSTFCIRTTRLENNSLDYINDKGGSIKEISVHYEGFDNSYSEDRIIPYSSNRFIKVPYGHLSEGTYIIYITATDYRGNYSSKSVRINVSHPDYSSILSISQNTSTAFSLHKQKNSGSFVYTIQTITSDSENWTNKVAGLSQWISGNAYQNYDYTNGFSFSGGFIRVIARKNTSVVNPRCKPIIRRFPSLLPTMKDYLPLKNGVQIYTDKGFLIHTLVSDEYIGEDISDWESRILLNSNADAPSGSAAFTDGTELKVICKDVSDYTVTPYYYAYPSITKKYAVAILYFPDGSSYLIPIKGF